MAEKVLLIIRWLSREMKEKFFKFFATDFRIDHTNINNECKQVFNIFKHLDVNNDIIIDTVFPLEV